jgi:hypothetical protein
LLTLGRLVPRQGVATGAFERAHDLVDLHFAEMGAQRVRWPAASGAPETSPDASSLT